MKLLFALCLFLVVVAFGENPDCSDQNTCERSQNSDILAIVKTKMVYASNEDNHNIVRVKEIFRSSSARLRVDNLIEIRSSITGGCFEQFELETKYLVSLSYDKEGRYYRLNPCGLNALASDLTPHDKELIASPGAVCIPDATEDPAVECSTVTCQPLDCTDPITLDGTCCEVCPGDDVCDCEAYCAPDFAQEKRDEEGDGQGDEDSHTPNENSNTGNATGNATPNTGNATGNANPNTGNATGNATGNSTHQSTTGGSTDDDEEDGGSGSETGDDGDEGDGSGSGEEEEEEPPVCPASPASRKEAVCAQFCSCPRRR